MKQPLHTDDDRWRALCQRAPLPDPGFFYGVVTTGIVCRPGCPSRLPNRENVRFFSSCSDALEAGYRPCKRCHPLDRNGKRQQTVEAICRWIEAHGADSSLTSLADSMGRSANHLQKMFREVTGITPFQYGKALRQRRLYEQLGTAPTVTRAMQEAGYTSSSRFYEEARNFSSVSPSVHRQGGRGETLMFAIAATSLGALAVAATDKGLCWISLGEDPEQEVEALQRHFQHARLLPPDEPFNRWLSQVVAVVENPGQGHDLPLDIRGTVFQQQVWEALRKIPPGTTLDYQTLAERVGRPGGARAVAGACGANVLAVLVPCHRIVRRDGSLSGYRWGVERKAALLDREKRAQRGLTAGEPPSA